MTAAMQKLGVRCRAADELATGGTDFTDLHQIDDAKAALRDERTEGSTIAFHMAPACATFSHARDRSPATRLRSSEFPEGLPDLDAGRALIVEIANDIALITFDVAIWGVAGSMRGRHFREPSHLVSMALPGQTTASGEDHMD